MLEDERCLRDDRLEPPVQRKTNGRGSVVFACRHVVMLTSSDSGYFCGTQDLSNGLHQDGSIGH